MNYTKNAKGQWVPRPNASHYSQISFWDRTQYGNILVHKDGMAHLLIPGIHIHTR